MKHTPLIALGMILVAVVVLGLIEKFESWAVTLFPCDKNCLDIAGLHAQQSMAVATWVGVAIGAVTLGLLWRTVVYARAAAASGADAVEEAKKATEAAQFSVGETRRIGEAQVRAYLSAYGFQAYIDGHGQLHIRFDYVNNGQTPARKVQVAVLHGFSGHPAPLTPVYGDRALFFPEDMRPNAPLSWQKQKGVRMSSEARQALTASPTALHLRVALDYLDVFGVNHQDVFDTWVMGQKQGEPFLTTWTQLHPLPSFREARQS